MHALGKLVFGFATFWAYIWVCQYLLIYYANIPEETIYYVRRTSTGWSNIFYLSLFLNWIIPFLMLIRRKVKSNENWMLAACAIVLVGHWVDLYVLIFPAFFNSAMISVVDIAIPIGFAGIFLFAFVRNFESRKMVPTRIRILRKVCGKRIENKNLKIYGPAACRTSLRESVYLEMLQEKSGLHERSTHK